VNKPPSTPTISELEGASVELAKRILASGQDPDNVSPLFVFMATGLAANMLCANYLNKENSCGDTDN